MLKEAAKKMPQYIKAQERAEIKYGILHLMLDVIWAFSDEKHKIQFPAMIYDIVRRMNQQEKALNEFYGKRAEEEIIRYTLSIVTLATRKEGCTESDWLNKALQKQDKAFAREFGKEMQGMISKMTSDVQKKEEKKCFPLLLQVIMVLLVAAIIFWGGIQIGRFKGLDKVKVEQWENEIEILREENLELKNDNKELNKQNADLEKEKNFYQESLHSVSLQEDGMSNESKDSFSDVSGNRITGVNLNADESKYRTLQMPFERNIRNRKTTSSEVAGVVNEGENVLILLEADEDGWMAIQYESSEGDIVGYVYMKE